MTTQEKAVQIEEAVEQFEQAVESGERVRERWEDMLSAFVPSSTWVLGPGLDEFRRARPWLARVLLEVRPYEDRR